MKPRQRALVAHAIAMCSFGITIMWTGTITAQAPEVRLEVVASPDVGITAQHDWLRRLGERGFADVRVSTAARRQPRSREARLPAPSITQRADGSVQVTAVLSANEELALPGLNVTRAQVNRIDDWLTALTAAPSEPQQMRHAFGLSADQLVKAHNSLAVALDKSTSGKPAGEVIDMLRETLSVPIVTAPSAARGLEEEFEIIDELEGVSAGTALAAVLRPLGLVMVPRSTGGRLELVVTASSSADEFWPIGWPLEKKANEVAPDLFKFIPIDINNARLMDALGAIRSRLKIPMLFDHNGLARAEIELEEVRVTVPATKTFYKKAMTRVLAGAKLRGELRVDEQGKPFYWITPRIVK